jgi:hypothetical protein
MTISRDDLEDQESSIKSRANEVFSESNDLVPIKSFAEYLSTTPPAPLSTELKALLWVVGFIVAMLFVAALLRIQLGRRRPLPAGPPSRAAAARPQRQGVHPGAASVSPALPRIDPWNHNRPPNAPGPVPAQVPNSGRRVES